MTEIHILSTRTQGADQIARLEADLTAAHEAGTDLGSRVPHIQAAGATLQHMGDELQRAIDRLQDTLESLGLANPDMRRVLNQLVRETAELSASAARFPADT